MDLRAGEQFERYIVERLLAETRLSRVWLARDTEENRTVALKIVRRIAENDDIVEAARSGAALQQALSERDARIVKIHRFGETSSAFFIDMEYVEGKDVSRILQEQGRIPPDEAVRIALEVSETLDNLQNHSCVVVHGDLKPKNIRIDGESAVKLLDFGTAKALSQSKPGGTRAPAWSPAYASPELLERSEMNPLSDRWALGVTLYEMVTGRVPFGAGKTIEEIETEIRNRPRMPDLDVPDCPAALHTILFKLLNPDTERRYQSAKELWLDLKNYPEMPKVAGYQGETVRSAAPESGAVTRRSTVAPRRPQQPPPKPRPATQRELIIRAAIIIVAIFFTVWVLVRESRAIAEARKLAADLAVERISVTAAREQYEALRKRRFTWIPTRDIERLLSSGLITRGDAIITRFRTVGVKIAEWRQARSYFEQALESNPKDEAIRGRLRICDAHLARYQGQAEKSPDSFESSERLFREAARLLRDSPDPWLGIAMLEIYNRKEPEAGEVALTEAKGRSFDFTTEDRWVGLLAETYRTRADSLEWEAQRIVRTLPTEAEERLERAASYHQKAIDWYSRAPLYGDALQEIERCREAQARIESRLEEPEVGQAPSLRRAPSPPR